MVEIDRILARRLDVDIEGDRENGRVEIDGGAPHQRRQRLLGGGGLDPGQFVLQGTQPDQIDALLIHEGFIEGADLRGQGIGIGVGFGGGGGRVFHQLVETLLGAVGHFQAARHSGLVAGDLMAVEPRAIGIAEEIIAGARRRILILDVETPVGGEGEAGKGKREHGPGQGQATAGLH